MYTALYDGDPHVLLLCRADCCVWTDQLKTPLVKRYRIVALVRYQGNEINKPLHSNGHVSMSLVWEVPTVC
jgi:hypothetical protein